MCVYAAEVLAAALASMLAAAPGHYALGPTQVACPAPLLPLGTALPTPRLSHFVSGPAAALADALGAAGYVLQPPLCRDAASAVTLAGAAPDATWQRTGTYLGALWRPVGLPPAALWLRAGPPPPASRVYVWSLPERPRGLPLHAVAIAGNLVEGGIGGTGAVGGSLGCGTGAVGGGLGITGSRTGTEGGGPGVVGCGATAVGVGSHVAGNRAVAPAESTASPAARAEAHLAAALLAGIAHRRDAVAPGVRLPWVELRHGPSEIEAWVAAGAAPLCAFGLPPPATNMLPLAPLRGALTDAITWRDNRGRPQVALTFDACSTFDWGPYSAAVIEQLRALRIPATLFLGGHWAELHPESARALAAEPLFELGNHTYSHPHMVTLAPGQQRQELLWTQAILFSLTGRLPRYFRPPYGEVDDALVAAAAQVGLMTVAFDLPAGDADPHVSAARLTEWVVRKATSGSIVIMHMNHPTSQTAAALPAIAAALRRRGYVFAQVGELLAATP